MTITLLFWNVRGRNLAERVGRIARTHQVDLVCLAECQHTLPFIEALTAQTGRYYHDHSSPGGKTRLLTRFEGWQISHRLDTAHSTFTHLMVGPSPGVLFVAVHFPSRGAGWNERSQGLEATRLASDIAQQEQTADQRTILMGDLNMDPYDTGMVASGALHGLMTRALVSREDRQVLGRSFPMFYNPMWGCYGDRTPGPPGTFFRAAAEHHNPFWHMYDQVLVRPRLMNGLKSVAILETDGVESLLTPQGRPSSSRASDHLPLLCTLEV